MSKLLKIGTLIPVNLLNNTLASFSLTNIKFLLSHTAHFYKSISIPFLVFTTFGFFDVFFQHFEQ